MQWGECWAPIRTKQLKSESDLNTQDFNAQSVNIAEEGNASKSFGASTSRADKILDAYYEKSDLH